MVPRGHPSLLYIPDDIFVASAVSAQLMVMSNKQTCRQTHTDRETDSQTDTQRHISQNISNNRLHFCIFALCELNPVVSLSSAKNKKKVHCVAPRQKNEMHGCYSFDIFN